VRARPGISERDDGNGRACLAVCVAVGMVTPAMTEDFVGTGAWLAENCSQKSVNWKSGYCLGYISGVADALHQKGEIVCIPPGATGAQITKIAVKYLDDHPENLHL